MLKPIVNTYRTVLSLDGYWLIQFVEDGYECLEPLKNGKLCAVPSSLNDLYTEAKWRDYVGLVVYEKTISIPQTMKHQRVFLRVGAGGNKSKVYFNGVLQGDHNGAFLPYEFVIPQAIVEEKACRISIVLDTRLDFTTLPIGEVLSSSNKQIQSIHHDFLNYTGLHRSIVIYSIPDNGIEDISIQTSGHEEVAMVEYSIQTSSHFGHIEIINPLGEVVARRDSLQGSLEIANPILWDVHQGNLYQLIVKTPTDEYTQSFGIRDIEVKNKQLLLNGKPIYLKGFGMHEDHITIGKGVFPPLLIRDFELIQWMNANSFRTSHYPYAEDYYELADQMGILVINEVAAVGLNFWSNRIVFQNGTVDERLLQVHKDQITELVQRDKNHPCVIMLSVANEANTHEDGAFPYFSEVVSHARKQTNIPIMIVEWVRAQNNKVASLVDVIGVNRYLGWYSDFGDLQDVEAQLIKDLQEYNDVFQKPILLSEFGADTIAGLHQLPSTGFSEEFQVEMIECYQKAISKLPFVIGEHVWNFADFMTKQGLTRVNGNKKGLFTRDRQPKMAAHRVREYWKNH